ncbi:MAG: DMT family transporter [Pseudomonadota bacterium]
MRTMQSSRLTPYLLILIAGVIWGSTFSLALIATEKGAHPVALTTWQVVLTAAIFALVCFASKIPAFRLVNWHYYVVIAIIGIIAPDLLYYNAAPHLSAGILSITVSTVPLFTYAIMWMMRFEAFAIKRALGIVLGMIAILMLVLPDQGLESSDASFWILLVVLCAVCYAIENVYIGEHVDPQLDIRELLSGANIVAAVVLLPSGYAMGTTVTLDWFFTAAGLAIIGIALSSSVAYLMFFYTIKSAGPVFASQCAYIVTLSGVVWGIIIFAEQHTLWVWLSVIVMMLGLALVTPREQATQFDQPARDAS